MIPFPIPTLPNSRPSIISGQFFRKPRDFWKRFLPIAGPPTARPRTLARCDSNQEATPSFPGRRVFSFRSLESMGHGAVFGSAKSEYLAGEIEAHVTKPTTNLKPKGTAGNHEAHINSKQPKGKFWNPDLCVSREHLPLRLRRSNK